MLKLIKNLKFLFMPHYWVMLYQYSYEWDIELNRLLDNHRFVALTFSVSGVSDATVLLGGHEIWCANHPFASFRLYRSNVRPSRKTLVRAMQHLKKDLPDWPNSADVSVPWIEYAHPELCRDIDYYRRYH